ncbi:hypothetical protein CDD82_3219 [Ophiocordyceps australis]|uniref:Major facilitator superfamily (MFS) profile domain-containing protein n=1 Tax=Ophiocordyceps australis TaxID=1399860 RepID=A0A2C5ZTI6_9HYPO|nr:hypothetical protein CDD82_3219 [Ophiocordyceps australis]
MSTRARPSPVGGQQGSADADEVDWAQFDQLSRSLPTSGPVLEPEPSDVAMLRPVMSNLSSTRSRSDTMSSEVSRVGSVLDGDVDAAAEQEGGYDGVDVSRVASETDPLLVSRQTSAGNNGNGLASSDAGDETPPFLNNTSPGRFWFIFSQILMAQFISCFDGTIMASSHPVITSYFGAANSASWLSTAFLLTSTAFQPLVGRLSDAVGRKPLFLGCLVVFACATTWCALAGSIESFIAGRALCGLGAGGAMTLGSIITSDLVPIERRGAYQSYMNVTYGIGSALGAALGGAMAEALGWRWEFGVQIPPLLLCFCVSAMALPPDLGKTGEPTTVWQALQAFDARGSVLLTLAVCFLILGLNLGGNVFPWSHPLVIASLLIFAVCFPALVWVEARVSKPIMPLHLVRYAPRANLIYANFIAAIISNSIFFNIPLYFQAVLLTSATSSGLRLMLPSIVSSIAGTSTGFAITWTRRLKWPLWLGTFSYLIGTICLAFLHRNLPLSLYLVVLVPSSLGQGFQFPGTFMAILACSPQSDQAVVTSTLILWRSLGMVLGVASSSLVVQNALVHYLGAHVHGPEKESVIARVRASVEAIARLEQPYRGQVIRSYEDALRLVFVCCIVLAAVSVCLIWPIKLPRLAQRKRNA